MISKLVVYVLDAITLCFMSKTITEKNDNF